MKKIINLLVWFALFIAAPAVQAAMNAVDINAARAAFDANTCGSCHEVKRHGIGPSLKEIAKKYKGKTGAAEIAQRIRAGSEGRWGGAPHPAYEALDEKEALLLATWILNGAP